MNSKKSAVFILLGQSNAVGHDIPMKEEDKIVTPLKNVFGLSRAKNQSMENAQLFWEGYVSGGMNLAEEQDHTYSIANLMAAKWQARIDSGENLPDLYIVQIAVGAQGITEKYMWYPERELIFKPGPPGNINISLYPYAMHILSLLDDSFKRMGKDYEIMGVHWRGGENDVCEPDEVLDAQLSKSYHRLLDDYNEMLHTPPFVLHRLTAVDRCDDMDPTGQFRRRLHVVNDLFETLEREYANVSIFDPRKAPYFNPDVRGNGMFIEDNVHFTPEMNAWVTEQIMEAYING